MHADANNENSNDEGVVISFRPRVRRRFISIAGGKGGVGKSTLAANLAAHYARTGSSTVIVDGDVGMADLNLLLGVAPEKSLLDVVRGTPVEDCLVNVHGLSLLPGLNGSYALANANQDVQARILNTLDGLQQEFETIIVDIAAGIDSLSMSIAANSDDVIVVVSPEPTSIADAYACLKVLNREHGIERAFVVVNSVNSALQSKLVFGDLRVLTERFLNIELVELPSVPRDTGVASAVISGAPVVLYRPDAAASRGIVNLAHAFDARVSRQARAVNMRKAW